MTRHATRAVPLLFVVVAAWGCGKTQASPDAGAPDVGASDVGTPDGGADPDAAADLGHDAGPSCTPRLLGPNDEPFETLSEYCFLGDSVLPFEPIAVLYADDSLKERAIMIPEGEKIAYDADGRWTFPDGTTLIKTFYYYVDARDPSAGRHLLETRLIVRQNGVWEPYIYVWNDEQTEAEFERLGTWVELDRIDAEGDEVHTRYRVPNKNQCGSCHDQSDALVPLGPRAFQLNSDYDYGDDIGARNQLEYWAERGMFDRAPGDLSTVFTLTDYHDETADLDRRARSYLEVNCAHCHNAEGAADPSGLKLSVFVTDPGELGVCRSPVAAGAGSGGFFYDIVPGRPDESIMIFRMSSVDPEIKMPELPTQTADDFGVRLMTDWISAMTPEGCD